MIKRLNMKYFIQAALSVTFLAFLSSCNEEFSRLIPDIEHDQDTIDVAFGTPKVLYIIVDGARGESVRTAGASHINALLDQSIYSWASLSDGDGVEKGGNWADMLTGVRKEKHGVIGNDFENSKFETFPLLYERIKANKPLSDLRVFTPSKVFKDHLTEGANVSEVLSNDQAVKDALISSLSIDTITLVAGHFTEVDAAGSQNGYDNTIPAYKSAILQFDAYVGEIMEALESRPAYHEENWLVVIASSKGGHFEIPDNQNDNTIFSNPDVNTFTIYYTAKYNSRFINKPYLGNRFQGDFIRFEGERYAEVSAGDNSVYNLGDEAFTIELKVKKNKGPNNNYKFNYPALLGKRQEWSSGWPTNGWVIFLEEDFWMFNARGTGDGNQVKGNTLADATWNSISVVGVIRDNERYVRTFTNGEFNNESKVQGWGNFDTDALLKMGYIQGNGHGGPDAYLADVRIWKVALPDDVVKKYSCDVGIDTDHPYYDFLAGYWPVVGSDGVTVQDEGPFGSHMSLKGGEFSSNRLAEYLCAPSADQIGELVPRNADIPAQIISWLKIPRQENWQFDGRVWLDR